jgi:photosystem II stability/assembly factor-like uncharacterized protein
MNGAQVDSGSHVQFHVSLSFPKHCLDLHGLTACPATSPAYSILVLKVTVPGRKTPVYVSIGLAGNGMVAKTILYSLRPATASVSKAATSTTVSHWWVTLAFANSRLGVVAEGSGVEQAAHCDLSVYATSDGGASWAARVLLTRRASCQAGGSTDQMAITTDGHWLLATPQGLFIGQVNHPGSELVQATHLDRSTPTKAICSVAASGSSVWLTLAETCGLRSPSVLLYSGDDGATWTRRTVPLGFFVDFASTFATPPDSLAATDPESLWLLGSATSRSPLVVARTKDAGRTWAKITLPCKDDDLLSGFVTVSGKTVTALCLGDPTAGFEPMEVISSGNAGVTWVERCADGPADLVRIVGSCPGGGYPGAIAAMPDGVLVMSLGYPVGGVDVSVDGGRTWKLGLRTAGTFLDNSQAGGADWILAVGPTSPGVRLAESTNGRTWRQVALP